MNNDLISRKWLTDAIRNRRTYLSYEDAKDVIDLIDNAPTIEEQFKEKVIELFNKYDVLILHIGNKLEPVRNTSKQDCYNLLYDIGELIEWRKVLFKKYHGGTE